MALNVSSNFASMSTSALTSMKSHQTLMGKSISHISSGTRYTSAKDGAAGYVSAKKIKSDIDGYNALYDNVQRGATVLNVAERGVSSILDTLNSMREISIQYNQLDATKDADQRAALNNQFTALNNSLTALTSVSYNGNQVLSSSQSLDFAVALDGMSETDNTYYLKAGTTSARSTSIVDENGTSKGSVTIKNDNSAIEKVTINNTDYTIDSTKLKQDGIEVGTYTAATATAPAKFTIDKKLETTDYTLNSEGKFKDPDGIVSDDYSVKYKTDLENLQKIDAVTINGTDYYVGTSKKLYTTAAAATADAGSGDTYYAGATFDSSNGKLSVKKAVDNSSSGGTTYNVSWDSIAGKVSGLSIGDPDAIKTAITNVTKEEAKIGAGLTAMENISTSLGNIASAQQEGYDSIADADIASEMTKYVKNNIYSQAAQAMISQANQSLAQVLNLLQ